MKLCLKCRRINEPQCKVCSKCGYNTPSFFETSSPPLSFVNIATTRKEHNEWLSAQPERAVFGSSEKYAADKKGVWIFKSEKELNQYQQGDQTALKKHIKYGDIVEITLPNFPYDNDQNYYSGNYYFSIFDKTGSKETITLPVDEINLWEHIALCSGLFRSEIDNPTSPNRYLQRFISNEKKRYIKIGIIISCISFLIFGIVMWFVLTKFY